ncbi:MAG: M1 family metallopeptidase [Micromonosporaceae bacterium]|nr:M1 family metallopeptidase [Micromonosporaceae bacterium]
MARPRGARRLAVAAAGLILLTACTPPPPGLPDSDPPDPTRTVLGPQPPVECAPVVDTEASFDPGAPGLCDSYYPQAGNGGYDVEDYHLDLTYDPATQTLRGVATITATATANLRTFNLDYYGPDIESVRVDDQSAATEYSGGELVVTPAEPIEAGTRFTIVARYGGKPRGYPGASGPSTGFLVTDDGAIALGQPQSAAAWFPVNDHPRDKATYTIAISVPSNLAALSNGVLESRREGPMGFTTWTWRESSPMAPYLATMVVGNYRVVTGTHDGRPVVTAVHTSLPTSVDAELARTTEVIDYLQTVFGPYPFDALGGIVVNAPLGYALETQARPVYDQSFFNVDQGGASWVIAHELAHQWYGDSVSIDDWREIWLNEGFATYAEWLWNEHSGTQRSGGATVQATFDTWYRIFSDNERLWRVPPGDPGADDLFHQAVYIRGAMTLHALRRTVGDEAFFRILPEWASRQKDTTGTTMEFIALAEEISGQELDQLFHDWLYSPKRPPRP